ncbi:hypothetical protein E2C01_053019 [Portunus trituberculatus]|uniref:Uncharacterized protein n=1 Tax=Portunus trituberculatus TaxID=210409 RepID=A0A5B7GQW2_PORTR|nr:hypothetical protein [Portunus trituberculatus]
MMVQATPGRPLRHTGLVSRQTKTMLQNRRFRNHLPQPSRMTRRKPTRHTKTLHKQEHNRP